MVQTCIVHLIRNSIRYVARQDWDKVARDLKPVYTAPSEAAATERFLEFPEKWGTKYPAVIKQWPDAWTEMAPFLSFDVEIRKVICSTNAIESVNARIRKAVRAGGHPLGERRAEVRLHDADEPGPDRQGRTPLDDALESSAELLPDRLRRPTHPHHQPLNPNNQDQPLIGQTRCWRSPAVGSTSCGP